MNTTFRPRPIPSRPEELAMSLVCRWGGVSVEMGLGERIPASLWDAASKDLFRKNLTQEELHATLVLDQKSSEARRSFQMLQASLSRLPTTQEFRAFVKGHFNPTTGVKKPFEVYIDEFIQNFDMQPKRGHLTNGSAQTKKKYQSHLNILRAFAKEVGEELSWENMDGAFCMKMKKWRAKQPAGRFSKAHSSEKLTAQTTIARWVKAVRGWISMAHKEGIHPYTQHKQAHWSTPDGDVLRWVLTEAQMRAFKDFEVIPAQGGSGAPRTGLKRVKDLFVVQCLTGVRFSDLKAVVEAFNEAPDSTTVTIMTKKTKKPVTIPIHPWIKDIALQYDGCQLPQPGSSQNFNTNLRRIAFESGLFDTMIDKPATDEHGNWKTVRTAQWEQLTSHTARRTFATLAVQRGTPIKVVMNITGHSTEREFNKYVNISAEKNAEVFASFWS